LSLLIGFTIVTLCIFGGYAFHGGNFSIIFQPVEFLVIAGAAVGGLIAAAPLKSVKTTWTSIRRAFFNKSYTREDYIEALLMVTGVFFKIRQHGLISLENDVDNPQKSPLFSEYPGIMNNRAALHLITDTLRTVMSTTIVPHQLEALVAKEMDTFYEESMAPVFRVNAVADGLPGLGIVVAVMGIVLTMGKVKEAPEVLAASIGAALVGTLIGVLLCYGYIDHLAKNMEHVTNEDVQYLNVIRVALLTFIGMGAAPRVAVEFGRRVIPIEVRPSFLDLEKILTRKGTAISDKIRRSNKGNKRTENTETAASDTED